MLIIRIVRTELLIKSLIILRCRWHAIIAHARTKLLRLIVAWVRVILTVLTEASTARTLSSTAALSSYIKMPTLAIARALALEAAITSLFGTLRSLAVFQLDHIDSGDTIVTILDVGCCIIYVG